jgi:hypothetical protein
VIDQFEEVFMLAENTTEACHFLDLIYAAVTEPRSPVRVVITLRADFYDRPLMIPDFSDLVRQRTEAVIPLTSAELEQTIIRPAARVGVAVEPKLVTSIVNEVSEQPGALPMLQYALTELFERRSDHTLALDAYRSLGGVLFRFNLPAPPGDVASPDHRAWWQTLSLNPVECLRVQHALDTFDPLAGQIPEVNAALAQLSVCIPWSEDRPFLLQMPGIGLVSAMTILRAIGDMARFPTPKHLVGYAGWGAGIRSSGQTSRPGPITQAGRGELRPTLIQAAGAAARYSPYWRDCFSRLAPHQGAQKTSPSLLAKFWPSFGTA